MFDELLRETGRGTGQPAVDQGVPERFPGNLSQLDEDRGISVEVRNREESHGLRREYCFLLTKILDAHRKDRALWWGCVPEPPEICLTESSFPCEDLASHGPGPIAAPFAFGDRRQLQRHPGHVVESSHTPTVMEGARPNGF